MASDYPYNLILINTWSLDSKLLMASQNKPEVTELILFHISCKWVVRY